MGAWAVVIGCVVLVVAVAFVLARQGSPPDRSDEEDSPRRPHVVDRPAGPDAEATGVWEDELDQD